MYERYNNYFVLGALILLVPLVAPVNLDRRGGYDIVIALQENIPQPENSTQYIENIQKTFQEFSKYLHTSTKQKFHIKSVDLVIPGSWTGVFSEIATSQSYHTADIRILAEEDSPRVENPNACGTAGNFIELPRSFFINNPEYGYYGNPGKALLNLWARFRFGIWEEHGYPNDSQFPYVYQRPSLEPIWSATGCSNTEIFGQFINRGGESCLIDGSGKPGNGCKFEPTTTNTATSSLLHFQWLDSVTEFCDLRTHNYAAPNRQNVLCGYRSAWEIIRETADFRRVNRKTVENIPAFKFNILSVSQKPLFYLLIDNGRSIYPVNVVRDIMTAIAGVYDDLENIAAIGSFPNLNPRHNLYVSERAPWSSFANNSSKEKFIEVLEDLTSNEGAVVRDFGLAILETFEQIKSRNHKAGAVILVVKRGAAANTFNRIAYEQEVISALHEQTNIKLFAVELKESEKTPYANLNSIIKNTEGRYFLIQDQVNTARKLSPFLDNLKELLKRPISSSGKYRTITKQFINANENGAEFHVLDGGYKYVQVHLTTSSNIRTSAVDLTLVAGNETHFEVFQNQEWDENIDPRRRSVHTFAIRKPQKGSIWSIRFSSVCANIEDCTGFLVVYGEVDELPKSSESDRVDVTVSTSADNGFVDMSRQDPKPVPFAVYAKVEIHGQPVLNLKDVHAIIRLSDNSKNWRIPLHDDGRGNPDVASGDGIYSNVFTPEYDGFYRISVLVEYYKNTNVIESSVSGIGRLISANQEKIGCYNSTSTKCVPAKPTGFFSKISDLPGQIAIENCATFIPGKPMKITDFKVDVLPNFRVTFSFTSPKLLGSDKSPQEFQIFMAPSPNNYLGTTEQTKLIIAQIGEKTGNHIQIPYYTLQTALPYYAVEAIYNNIRSGPSNIVGVNTEIPSLISTSNPHEMQNNNGSSSGTTIVAADTSYSSTTETIINVRNSALTIVQITYIVISISIVGILSAVAFAIWRHKRSTKSYGSAEVLNA